MRRWWRGVRGFVFFSGILVGSGVAVGTSMGCGPLPGDRPDPPPAVEQGGTREVVTVYTDNPRYFYLVDTRRALCFFGDRRYPQLTNIPCEELPEARDLLGLDAAPLEGEGVPVEGDPLPVDGLAPDGGAAAPEELPTEELPAEDLGAPVSDEERPKFEAAYIEMFCAPRRPSDAEVGPPDEAAVAERSGLTSERFRQIRGQVAKDAAAWRALSSKALATCP